MDHTNYLKSIKFTLYVLTQELSTNRVQGHNKGEVEVFNSFQLLQSPRKENLFLPNVTHIKLPIR